MAANDDYCTLAELKDYILEEEYSTFTADAGTDKLTLDSVKWANNLQTGAEVEVTSSGTPVDLPAPLAEDTVYYVIKDADQLIQLATSSANADAGTNIDLTGAGTGTHTVFNAASDDELLQDAIDDAVDYIESYTHHKFVAYDQTRYYDESAVDGRVLHLDAPLRSITTLLEGDDDTTASKTTISSDDYWLQPRNDGPPYWYIQLKVNGTVSSWSFATDGWIEVEGSWGITATPPEDIKTAVRILAKYWYDQRRTEGHEVIVTPGDGTIRVPEGIPTSAFKRFDRYKRLV